MHRLLSLEVGALLVACVASGPGATHKDGDSGSSSTTPAPGTTVDLPNAVELGTGATQHTALQAGGPILVIDGGQSGAHVEVSGRTTGFATNIVAIDAWATLDGEPFAAMQASSLVQLAGHDPVSGEGWFAGERSFTDVEGVPLCEAAGSVLELCLRVDEYPPGGDDVAEVCVQGVIAVEQAVADQC